MKSTIPIYLGVFLILFSSCQKDDDIALNTYQVRGRVVDQAGNGLNAIQIYYGTDNFVLSDSLGNWTINYLINTQTITPQSSRYVFEPSSVEVRGTDSILFVGTKVLNTYEQQIFEWFSKQQLSNGLLESVEDGNLVSLYDNALAAMVFMLNNDFESAEKIFDFFNARINSEFLVAPGGFSQFRYPNGVPNKHRWMGDNAWLLVALNNYQALTGKTTYNRLSDEISAWLISLQDTDGGLFAGYDASDNLLNYKVTEGNIDAFNAIEGYETFHQNLLDFLEQDRWDSNDRNLVSWPGNPPYLYALDVHSWSYLIFEQYPVSALTTAERFLNTQSNINGIPITGYCFDEDQDVVWLEGSAQMCIAFEEAGMLSERDFYMSEIEKGFFQSTKFSDAGGFPYTVNMGTAYGSDPLWQGANENICISSGAWYLFATHNFNPFEVGKQKNVPIDDAFWRY